MTKTPAPKWAMQMNRITNYAVHDFGGGPSPWKFSWLINFQKCGTFFFLGLLMWYYQNFSTAAWVYLAIHGSYGIAWFIKDISLCLIGSVIQNLIEVFRRNSGVS